MSTDTDRRDQLRANLSRVQDAIAAACREAGRSPDSVRLIVVTKNFPAADAAVLVEEGQTDLGENRDQEAAGKAAELAAQGLTPSWHFVGQLQRNKTRSVASYASWVHSIDRTRLVDALDAAATAYGHSVNSLIQVSLDGDTSRGGVTIADLPALADRVAGAQSLRLRGVMAVAPIGWEPRKAFELLAECSRTVRNVEPAASEISAGMSGDYVTAIGCGTTMVRLGRNVLGEREPMA
ncbi:YggS family pyridoxal phosphate-dependent enzyme [Glycomyces buryatensis]|uniref:Pyridoxal phosphate homeostasis protein n=1 Tax=Glycomyces buryatensis TaxID=2570927 RepID=A0A4S8Q5J3_9ACTN|nr:YggS family pyridoxal phosphate-dependent enzyme [Glycomyces buryatensis]THV39523.1 YggS family pyridoxal phosphate-dependent enzyme [Glycomyces buryatensis]